ncbi:MAG: hypothetical protein WA210_20195 [Burkholderiaceae bacterium]
MTALRARPQLPADSSDEDTTPADLAVPDSGELIQHPDGWYWLADEGNQQFGPFASAADALADMNAASDDLLEPGETLEEAEDELGVAGWVDPETGELAEETHARIEDH